MSRAPLTPDQECQCACAALLREFARHQNVRRPGLIWREMKSANAHCDWTILAGVNVERSLPAETLRRLEQFQETAADERRAGLVLHFFRDDIMRDVRRNADLSTWWAWKRESWRARVAAWMRCVRGQ